MQHYDYLIAGSGLAGLYAAFRAARYGSVAIITKDKITESNSYYAQGGIAAVTDSEDSTEMHLNDTMEAGRNLCDYKAVEILVNEGPERIHELMEEGMEFDTIDGVLQLGLEGGHRKRRVLHAGGDITGRKITEFMAGKVIANTNITPFDYHEAIEIVKEHNTCKGLVAWDIKAEKEIFISATNTILAMGGASAIYERSTNPATSVGEGVAMAYKAGCKIRDIEFIQFHPTALCVPGKESYLISEAVRGEGAHLINKSGERFMKNIHPLAELAPRDVVAKGIFNELHKSDKGNPANDPFVYLSLKHLNSNTLKKRFPNIYKKCSSLGLDFTDKIPVAPAAHYMVGGVNTDYKGKTNIEHLYACGEIASTGIMGANRLASNSLAECLVFGYRAIEEAASNSSYIPSEAPPKKYFINNDNIPIYHKHKKSVAAILSEHTGIVRDQEGLVKAMDKIKSITSQLQNNNPGNEYYINKCNELSLVGNLIIAGAIERKESRGGHYRKDYPCITDNNPYHTIQQQNKPVTKTHTMSLKKITEQLVNLALKEDVGEGDVTTESIVPLNKKAIATLIMKTDGVISGIETIRSVFEHLDKDIVYIAGVAEGDKVKKGDTVLKIEGSYRALLTGERTALNILQRMSGIASKTAEYVKELEGTETKLLDTRKTAPGMRLLDKQAVKAGGGENHRIGLYDMAMIKDNHIKIAGGISNAVSQVKQNCKKNIKIEVETTNLEEVSEALASGADIIMLDNMDIPTMTKAVELIGDKAKTEASGNITLDKIREIAATGVNYISSGALTHSVKALDISMNISEV